MKLRNYTLRYLVIALLAVIALWATLFYMVIIEEVYDNIDDGLKNSKLLIVREARADKALLDTREYGIHQYKMEPLAKGGNYDYDDHFINTFEYMEYDEDNEPVRLLETVFDDASGNPHKLTIRASMVEEDELMEDLMTALIALYIMLVVSIAAINHLILRKTWKSFYQMLDRLKNYRLGTGTKFESPESPVTEFKLLGRELETLLQRNEEIYTSQKQFIENASHELQTPLAISLNKLELFAEHNNLPETQMLEIEKISDTLNRLVRLNKSLLMLSKIENRQFTDEEAIDLGRLAQDLIADFEDLAEYKNVVVSYSQETNLPVNMSRGLAVVLLSNLIKNAIVHNTPGGTVTIALNSHSLSVSNTASGTALDNDAVFTRFYKASGSSQSTGLGLAIVKSVTSVYGFGLSYSYDGSHTFTITFR